MLATLLAASALAAAPFPQTIDVPAGSRPEGIASGKGNTFYVGSREDGSVYKGSYRTGAGAVLVQGDDVREAYGLKLRGGKLYVAGGPTGVGHVYDARTGALLDTADFDGGFVNDVTVTRTAAYFTDSRTDKPFIYRYDRATGESTAIPISGDMVYGPGFNANGIAATRDGKTLILVQSSTGKLFTADPDTGVTDEIAIPAPVTAGDGILLRGTKLYVVRNQFNEVVKLRLEREAHRREVGDDADRRGLRHPDDDRGQGPAPVRDQRALQHAADAGDDVRRRARRSGSVRISLQ